jgi:acyl-ACP thioesterase
MTERWAAYRAPYRVRFDEAGPDGTLRTSGFLRYAQDVAWMHSVARGFDRSWYAERGLNWVVRAVDLDIVADAPMGVTLEATTAVLGQRRVWARRRGEFRLDGRLVASVQTDWLLLDNRNRPTRLPPEFEGAFLTLAASDSLARVDAPPPPADALARTFRVRPHELDPMGHVNNAIYVDWLEEVIPVGRDVSSAGRAGSLPCRLQLEYVGSAGPGDELIAIVWPHDAGWFHRLDTARGQTLVKARLSIRATR